MTTPLTPQEEIAFLQQEIAKLRQAAADEELKLKKVEFYAASTNAWFNTSLEFDKSMFALSGGGIGLLVSLMSKVETLPMFLLYIAAIICFVVCIGLLLAVFQKNKAYMITLVQDQQADSSLLMALDTAAAVMFGFGSVLTVIIGIVIAMQGLKLN